jgi:catechol 1,2-dioxygenase
VTTLEAAPTTTTPAANARVEAIVNDVLAALFDIITRHRVTAEEYRAATAWLNEAGSMGYEIPLLLDVFLATTIDDLEHPADGGTETNVEGPFYLAGSPRLERPYVLPRRADEPGEVMVLSGTVRAVDGSPLAGATVDIWQANGAGEYSHFSPDTPEDNLRGRLVTDADGTFEVETVVPVCYGIPNAGPTGRLLAALGRPTYRPGHIHVKISADGCRPLTTQLYMAGDPYLDRDVVLGAVKDSLVVTLDRQVRADGSTVATSAYDFVLTRI